MSHAAPAKPISPLLAWLRLFRLPNVFTAVADIAMGFLVARGSLEPIGLFAGLAISSALLYTAGMVLNDVFDYEVDAHERPFRPLPAGQISLPLARALGFAMLGAGVVIAVVAGLAYPTAIAWRSGLVALLLAGSVLLYDGWLKNTLVGPLGMGLCRFFNVLLGMSAGAGSAVGWPLGYDAGNLLPAAGIGTYIVGVTWFARGEAGHSQPVRLIAAMVVMAGGIVLLGCAANYFPHRMLLPLYYWLLLALLIVTVLRRALMAVMDPAPPKVQVAVKQAIFSLIMFDASISLMVAPSIYAIGIVALLVPMVLLGRWVYST
jgi:4-hydroxybenzoate polyprenyltransferase